MTVVAAESDRATSRVRWLTALLGGVLLGCGAPPAIVPFAEWLVLPGLAIWFALATASRRPLWVSYLFGCAYMAWFSWSVHHVLLAAYLAIVFVGGLYFLLGSAVVRGAPQRLRPLAFAIAVGGSFWLRAVMPEIHYPHGQPCHFLWQWPSCMQFVVLGGEPLMNAGLGLLGALGCEGARSWRTAVPAWRGAIVRLVVAVGIGVLLTLAAGFVGSSGPSDKRTVRIAAVEPGFHPEEFQLQDSTKSRSAYQRLLRERLIEPTRSLLASDDSLDLVLWPESVLMYLLPMADVESGRAILRDVLPASRARLVAGGNILHGDVGDPRAQTTPSALLIELPTGRVLDHQGKQCLVPGGEFLPLLGLLPADLADSLREIFRAALGTAPNCQVGEVRPPLQTERGHRFGALMCYDNAFFEPAAQQVEQGAEFLVVLSNEAWYRGGAELSQLVAMTVVRAIENRVPIVRCTLDGLSVAVDAFGRVVAGLELAPAPQPAARILQVSVAGRQGPIPPLAWLRRASGPILALLMALGLAHAVAQWVRIRAASTAPPTTAS